MAVRRIPPGAVVLSYCLANIRQIPVTQPQSRELTWHYNDSRLPRQSTHYAHVGHAGPVLWNQTQVPSASLSARDRICAPCPSIQMRTPTASEAQGCDAEQACAFILIRPSIVLLGEYSDGCAFSSLKLLTDCRAGLQHGWTHSFAYRQNFSDASNFSRLRLLNRV